MKTYYTDFRVKITARNIDEAITKSRELEEYFMDHHNNLIFIKGIGLALSDRERMVGDSD